MGKTIKFLTVLLCVFFSCKNLSSKIRKLNKSTKQRMKDDKNLMKSLSFVYYRNNQMPPKPTAKEIKRAKDLLAGKIKKANKEEIKNLKKLYAKNYELVAYATRDSDNDGLMDYRIAVKWNKEFYKGKFYEADIDVDNDGIQNVYDSEPYNPKVGGEDLNNNGIPDVDGVDYLPKHLDWSYFGKSKKSVQFQKKIFKENKIVLIERSSKFGDDLIDTLKDVMTKVYKPIFSRTKTLPTLRVISTEDYILLDEQIDDGTEAAVFDYSQTLTIYKNGANKKPLLRFGLLAHELAHSFHYSMDFLGHTAEADGIDSARPKFIKFMKKFGWDASTKKKIKSWNVYKPAFAEGFDRYLYTYREKKLKYWFDKIIDEDNTPEFKENIVLGSYAMTNSLEYFADSVIAYTFLKIEKAAVKMAKPEERSKVQEQMRETVLEGWPKFYYWNIEGSTGKSKILNYLTKKWPLKNKDLRELSHKYLLEF